jgi:hypothetical protein
LGKQRLVFSSKDPAFLFPSSGNDRPTQGGVTVEIFSTVEPAGAAVTAPATGVEPGWRVSGNLASYRFRRDRESAAATPVRRAVLRQGRTFKVVLDEAGLALAAPQGAVGIRIRTGALRNCARFAGTAVVTDKAGLFVGQDASAAALPDCTTNALLGLAPSPPTCGDGVINGTEVCDGADRGICGEQGGSCRPPGVAGECTTCCEIPFAPFPVCCNPSSIVIPNTPGGNGICVATRCDPPFDCGSNTCQPDGSCCTPKGGSCVASLGGQLITPLNPCCDGLVCAGVGGLGQTCCVPAAGACTADADCCSGHCDAGVCAPCMLGGVEQPCCVPALFGCTVDGDCCSQHCDAGTCAPVAATARHVVTS